MKDELKDILSNNNKDIDNQALIKYLSEKLSPAEEHSIEKTMSDDAFTNDAVEGLQQMESKRNLQLYMNQLNYSLRQQISGKKKRKDKRRRKDQPVTLIAVIILLVLLIISYALFLRLH